MMKLIKNYTKIRQVKEILYCVYISIQYEDVIIETSVYSQQNHFIPLFYDLQRCSFPSTDALRLALLPSGEGWNLVGSRSTIDCREVVALVPRFHPPLAFVNLFSKLLRQLRLLSAAKSILCTAVQ